MLALYLIKTDSLKIPINAHLLNRVISAEAVGLAGRIKLTRLFI